MNKKKTNVLTPLTLTPKNKSQYLKFGSHPVNLNEKNGKYDTKKTYKSFDMHEILV